MHQSSFRQWISAAPGARFAPEPDRYHLYVMRGCPWAHRTLIARKLKGLEAVIGMTAVHHHLVEGVGWTFSPDRPDPLYGATRLRELYEMARPGYDGRVTVPVLWDKRERTIVNNESAEIVRMLATEFDDLASQPSDLYPEWLRPEIDRWNARIQPALNEGAYAAGFAANQSDYEHAAFAFFAALDELESHLSTQRFLAGSQPTEADWRLFPTLIRFEWVYHGLFKLDRRRLVDYPNLLGFARDLYQWPGIADTVSEHDIRNGYWTSMIRLNPGGIVPMGPAIDFTQPHGRHRLAARQMTAA
jgi:putative glutathione S-transferase